MQGKRGVEPFFSYFINRSRNMNYNLRRTYSRDFKADERISGKFWTKLSTATSHSCTGKTFRCEHIYKFEYSGFYFITSVCTVALFLRTTCVAYRYAFCPFG
jgi:hypothetical protein